MSQPELLFSESLWLARWFLFWSVMNRGEAVNPICPGGWAGAPLVTYMRIFMRICERIEKMTFPRHYFEKGHFYPEKLSHFADKNVCKKYQYF